MYGDLILISALDNSDTTVYEEIQESSLNYYFSKATHIDLFTYMLNYYRKNSVAPTREILTDVIKHERDDISLNVLKNLYKNKNKTKAVSGDDLRGYIDLQKKVTLKAKMMEDLLDLVDELEDSTPEELEGSVEGLHNISSTYKSALESESNEEMILHEAVDATGRYRKDYNSAKKAGGNRVGYYGIKEIDSVFDGVRNTDFISIIGAAKQFKSTLLRNIAYNLVLQGKNILYATLEMSFSEVRDSFATMHYNNKDRFPDNGRITYKEVQSAEIEDEDGFFDCFDDLVSADDLGVIYLLKPNGVYVYDRFEGDLRRVDTTILKLDLACIDSVNLMDDGSMHVIDATIRAIRQLTLGSNNNEGFPFISPFQIKRSSFTEAEQTEGNLYTVDAIRMYSEINTTSTRVISVIQTEEMEESGVIQLQNLLSRDTAQFQPFKVKIDSEVGLIRDFTNLSDMIDSEEVSDETLDKIMETVSKNLFDD